MGPAVCLTHFLSCGRVGWCILIWDPFVIPWNTLCISLRFRGTDFFCLFLSWFSFSGVLWSLSNSGSLSRALWVPDTCPLWVSVSPSLWVFFPSWGFFLFLSLGLYPSPALCPPPLGFYPPIMSEQSTVSPPFPFPCGSDLHVWKENSMGRQIEKGFEWQNKAGVG